MQAMHGRNRRSSLWVLQALLCALIFGCWAAEAPAETLLLGVVPQHSAVELARQWGPLLKFLEERTGLSLAFETAKDIPTFEARLDEGRYDIIYCNPADYVLRSLAPGYQAFAREKGVRLKGIVVVPRDSPATSLNDLAGGKVAFPAPAAFAATMLPLADFKARGVAVTPVYVATHDSVYLTVARGYYPAGGGIARTLANCPEDVRGQLRVIWETPGCTPHPLAAHPRVGREAVARLAEALEAMDQDEAGRSALRILRFAGFERGTDADWNDVRALLGLPAAGAS